MAGKRASQKQPNRWEQFNRIVDEIGPTLPTPTHLAIVLACFRHGRGHGYFRVSTNRIAKSVGLQRRRVQSVLDELETLGVITLETELQGPVPRVYRITFQVAQSTIDTVQPPSRMVQCAALNGAVECA